MISQFGGNPRIGNFGGWGFCRIQWNSLWNYLVEFLSAWDLVEIPELLNFGGLHFGGSKFWWL